MMNRMLVSPEDSHFHCQYCGKESKVEVLMITVDEDDMGWNFVCGDCVAKALTHLKKVEC